MKKKLVFKSLIYLFLVLSLLPVQKNVYAQKAHPLISPSAKYVPGEVIVLFQQDLPKEELSTEASAMAETIGAEVVDVDPIGPAALLRTSEDANIPILVGQLRQMEGVKTSEPNYIYSVPELIKPNDTPPKTVIKRTGKNLSTHDIKIDTLKAMKTVKGGAIQSTYPNDPSLWQNWGWDFIGASMVWSNPTPTRNVCIIDTGVDYQHPDLSGRVILGKDFVNGDDNPMDDYGHGTHVAGIIAAKMNNKQGIGGVGKGKVVAVKALDSSGSGSSYEITQAIEYCAQRSDVSVINMSLGGAGYSAWMETGVRFAKEHNKLIVASAGNDDTFSYCEVGSVPTGDARSYPAGFSVSGPIVINPDCTYDPGLSNTHDGYDNVLSVGAVDIYGIKAYFSNYGKWVNIAAPGVDIYSTMPWKKPFTLNFLYGYYANYDTLSGTSMAAPFVAGTAARVWGYTAMSGIGSVGESYQETLEYLKKSPYPFSGGQYNWPTEQGDSYLVNVAAGMDRGALVASVFDAHTGLPLSGSKVSVFAVGPDSPTASLIRSATTTSTQNPTTDLINLPITDVSKNIYRLLVSKSGYTNGYQDAFVGWQGQDGWVSVFPGYWNGLNWDIFAAVPPKTNNFTAVAEWGQPVFDDIGNIATDNLDLLDYIPSTNPDFEYIVHPNLGNDFGWDEGYAIGNMTDAPYARYMYGDVPSSNILPFESTAIRSRSNTSALPMFQGTYTLRLTDTHAGSFRLNDGNVSAFLWKNGAIKTRVNLGQECNKLASGHLWWTPFTITSGASGSVVIFTPTDNCSTDTPVYP